MTTPTSGPISLANLQTEFGGSNPIGFDEYYRGGGLVPAGLATGTGAFFTPPASSAQVPTTGPIQLSQFYGVSSSFVFNDVVSSNMVGYSLGNRAVLLGWNGVTPLVGTTTVNYGVTITGVSPYPAMATWRLAVDAVGPYTSYPSGSSWTLVNNGNIIGGGGSGGVGGSVSGASFTNGGAGQAGGVGISFNAANLTQYVSNNGTIGGGGGGGGGGNATRATPDFKTYYGAGGGGGGQGAADHGSNAPGAGGAASGNGGKGGGDYPGSAGGTPSTPTAWRISPSIYTYGVAGVPGVLGGAVRGGYGGTGGEAGMPGFPGDLGDQNYVNGGQGAVGTGGARGLAVQSAAAPSWYDYGNIRGALDGLGFWASGGVNHSSQLASSYTSPLFNSGRNAAYTTALGEIWYGQSQNCGLVNVAAGTTTYSLFYTNTGAPFSAHLYGAVDNYISQMTVNGVAFAPGSMNTAGGNWYNSTFQTSAFTIATGFNVITISVTNTVSSAAAFNLRLRDSGNVDRTHPSMWYIGGNHATPTGTILPSGSSTWSSFDYQFPGFNVTASLGFTSAGSVNLGPGDTGVNPNWINPIATGIGSSYWIRFTITSSFGGGTTSMTTGTWLSLASGQTVSVSSGGGVANNRYVEFTAEFSTNSSGTNIVAVHTGNVLEAEHEQ